jgi:hypothetical protein
MVPTKFSVFKEQDKFHLNTNLKLLLQKYGFKPFFPSDTIPIEIRNTACNKLYASLEKDNDLFSTKVKIVLKNCNEEVVYQTNFGSSREKDLLIAYNKAFREAAKSFDLLNYKYNGKNDVHSETTVVINKKENSNTVINTNTEIFYFAQTIANGFQVVNNEPKVVMRLLNTSQKNVFIGMKDNSNGVVFQKDNQWYFEYYESGKLVSELMNLKF